MLRRQPAPIRPVAAHRPAPLVWGIAGLLLVAMAAQLLLGALADSATSDEPIHILSGYVTLTQRHALLDPEHPFPVKAIAALPLLLLHPAIPADIARLTPQDALPGYDTYATANAGGFAMLFTLGNDSRLVLLLPRLVIILATLLFAVVLFLWTRALFGEAAGLVALALAAFDPAFLANGHLANDDTVAALALLVALAAFHRYLRRPARRSMALAGLAFGAALMTKYTLLLLGPTYVILLAVWILGDRPGATDPEIARRPAQARTRWCAGLLGIFTIGWLTIWLCYGALTLLNPAQNPTAPAPADNRLLALAARLVPTAYAKGLAGVAHPRTGYLLGACFTGSRLDYFPLLALFKLPLPTLILIGVGAASLLTDRRRDRFTPLMLLLPLALFLLASGVAGIDIGVRHLLPVYAPLLMVAASPASRLAAWARANTWTWARSLRAAAPALGLAVLLAWLMTDTVQAAPNYLPYFNELAAEPRPIPYVASDSNVDWGQGTRALASYVHAHGITRVALANFISSDEASALGIPFVPADPNDRDYSGYVAISRSLIVADRCGGNEWGWLVDHRQPVAIIAGAINLYLLP